MVMLLIFLRELMLEGNVEQNTEEGEGRKTVRSSTSHARLQERHLGTGQYGTGDIENILKGPRVKYIKSRFSCGDRRS